MKIIICGFVGLIVSFVFLAWLSHHEGHQTKTEITRSRAPTEISTPTEMTTPLAYTDEEKQKRADQPWYVGGTLHKATLLEWNEAEHRNRLATAADAVAKVDEIKAITPTFKLRSIQLESCVSTMAQRTLKTKDDNKKFGSMDIRDVLALCYTSLPKK